MLLFVNEVDFPKLRRLEHPECCALIFARPAAGHHSLQSGASAVLPLLPVPASVPPGAG